jgi:hypothetical protein
MNGYERVLHRTAAVLCPSFLGSTDQLTIRVETESRPENPVWLWRLFSDVLRDRDSEAWKRCVRAQIAENQRLTLPAVWKASS